MKHLKGAAMTLENEVIAKDAESVAIQACSASKMANAMEDHNRILRRQR